MPKNEQMPATNTGWNIQPLLQNELALQTAKEEWERDSLERPHLSSSYSKKDLDSEFLWFKSALSKWLDKHAKKTRVTSFLKDGKMTM